MDFMKTEYDSNNNFKTVLLKDAEVKPTSNNENNMESLPLIKRFFTKSIKSVFDTVTWKRFDACITNDKGDIIFELKDVEFPANWSQMAVNVVASKYFINKPKINMIETSLKQMISRVTRTIAEWSYKSKYITNKEQKQIFEDELSYILLHQMASFNSPVWFNCGVEEHPQCSACFINSVEDTMDSILDLVKVEGKLFKYGSGSGTNFSKLRASNEMLSNGGIASGPVSFMKGYDAFAGVIKSGGKTRRAAKMVILDISHPDIMEFITCKADEEKKAHSLIAQGYDGSFNGEAYSSIFFQNANNSVRVSDDYMSAVQKNADWHTYSVTDGKIAKTFKSRSEILKAIVDSIHFCGDPGIQFDSTINEWNTCSVSGRINASNPCSEFMFLDDSACNLASINLMKFLDDDGNFKIDNFLHTINILILAQDVIVDNSSYPTPKIAQNSSDYRPLGLGYANLGAILMALALPYDSDEGRAFAACITSILTGQAYKASSILSEYLGSFKYYNINKMPMLSVIQKHSAQVSKIQEFSTTSLLKSHAAKLWKETYDHGIDHGFRNSQVTVLAPTGTIAFMMDCDTTGIEPDIALVKYKKLVGGGVMKIVNKTVPLALKRLGYDKDKIDLIIEYISNNSTIEGCPYVNEEDLPIFDCAFKPISGVRVISYMGHIKMMGAVQPFISGAISKTVNLNSDVTAQEIENIIIESWKLKLKSVAIYRDGSKMTQPLTTSLKDEKKKTEVVEVKPERLRLPDERRAITHKFSIGGHEGYITAGMYENGQLGEIFIVMAKEGSVISGTMDSFATSISIALQYGVPLKVLVDKFIHTRYEPSGWTGNKAIPIAKSITDYIFRWLALKFLPDHAINNGYDKAEESESSCKCHSDENANSENVVYETQSDAPPCTECGSIMVRSGTCYKCVNCGITSGCS